MILLRLNGGLGNQMFQYAFSKALAHKYRQKIYFDHSQFEGSNRKYSLDLFDFNISPSTEIDPEDIKDYECFLMQESHFNFDRNALRALDGYNLIKNIFLISGYWQSYKYFSSISKLVRVDYRLTYKIDKTYYEIQEKIKNSKSVMIHVRRGDYLLNGNLEKHGVIDIEYIKKGMTYYIDRLPKPVFFVFSDDIEWCKANIPQFKNTVFFEKDCDEGKTSFSLMRQCQHFLISNSTFSWWAAWLSDYKKKHVICPKNWFRENDIDTSDLIPPNWKRY